MTRQEADTTFLTAVGLMANKHGCKIVAADTTDPKNPFVALDCPKETELACAIELTDILTQYEN